MNATPLYERDPDAYRAYLAEGNRKQARKRVGADALLRDETGRILIVDPNYKDGWDLPGGMCEANEAPLDALRRELAEELALHIDLEPELLVVDWVAPHDQWDDMMACIFDAGVLTTDQIAGMRAVDGELDGWEFVTPAQAQPRLKPYFWQRVSAALDALETGHTVYRHTIFPAR
ncbi:NUDIX domain-containing protein [Nocardia colli]|uniref:NUDIX domain-containing protein n=1 Tax=Nocardia colli TaxID=2545717 RepID=UPI0035E20068